MGVHHHILQKMLTIEQQLIVCIMKTKMLSKSFARVINNSIRYRYKHSVIKNTVVLIIISGHQ